MFTPDGREFYFAVRISPQKWTIMVMKRTGNRWGAPEVASFSGDYSDVDLFITSDGEKLFYCSNRPLSGRGEPKKDFDIWVVERVGQGWSEPRNLGAGEHRYMGGWLEEVRGVEYLNHGVRCRYRKTGTPTRSAHATTRMPAISPSTPSSPGFRAGRTRRPAGAASENWGRLKPVSAPRTGPGTASG